MENITISNFEKRITKKELVKEIKTEVKKLYNKSSNVIIYFEVNDYFIHLNHKQAFNLINGLYENENGLHKNYDDRNEGIFINKKYDIERKKKTEYYIHG